ncbi:MAG: type I methionyl aminopeptidase [Coriobacteriales bacterium]|nr:type I methionyl aminopeptidase [Coriobacteriales bacterium]
MKLRNELGIILKTQGEIEAMKEAGRVSAKALRMAGEIVRPGISTWDIDAYAEEVIRMEGGIPGFKGYGGFPGTICASVNCQVVHGIPSKRVILKEGDIISIDTGAVIDGWYGDNAWTFPVGEIAPRTKLLLETTEKALFAGLAQVKEGATLGDIGAAIQQVAERPGFGVVREYVGHGIGRDMHEPPNVPNYGKKGKGIRLEVGMCLAIEPMVNQGTRMVRQMPDGWTVETLDKLPSAHFEKSIALTADGPVILTQE